MAKAESVQQTQAAKLWEKIKDLPIDIFALPNQTVKNHVTRVEEMDNVFPNDIYVILRSAAAYPALEEALGNAQARNQIKLEKGERFELSQSHKYTVIKVIR
jgi:hypothetical protein